MNDHKTTSGHSDSTPGKGSGSEECTFIRDNQIIMHRKILQAAAQSAESGGGLLEIYRKEVLPFKTRTVRLLGVKCPAVIIQTLLGFEVKAHQKRIQCPDLVTARYLKLFSEIGCRSIRLPYDPTQTSRLVPILESALKNILNTVTEVVPEEAKLRQYTVRKIYAIIREDLRKATESFSRSQFE